tara:strand:- start:88 stop:357 length:270 start_codon:yes stop_codon:yes gene_type:complete
MAKYYTVTLTEAQYGFVLEAIDCYGTDVFNGAVSEPSKEAELMERTQLAMGDYEVSYRKKKITKTNHVLRYTCKGTPIYATVPATKKGE